MIDDLTALHARALECPGDDLPRLAYADALDERAGSVPCGRCNGYGHRTTLDPATGRKSDKITCDTCRGSGTVPDGLADRAAYIRWAVANPQNSAVCLCGCRGRHPQPCETCRTMGAEINGIPRRADGETHYVVNRGFIGEVRCDLADWQRLAPALLAAHPLERVKVADVPGLVFEVRPPGHRDNIHPRVGWVLVGTLSLNRVVEYGADDHCPVEIVSRSLGFPTRPALVAAAAAAVAEITARLWETAGDQRPTLGGRS